MNTGSKFQRTLVPGTVLILLSGEFKGSRVVYLGKHTAVTSPKIQTNGSLKLGKRLQHSTKKLKAQPIPAKKAEFQKMIAQKKAKAAAATADSLLLVAGPAKVNNIPIRRVNRRYVIRTSTVVDISDLKEKIDNLANFDKKWFKGSKGRKNKADKKQGGDSDVQPKEGQNNDDEMYKQFSDLKKDIMNGVYSKVKQTPFLVQYLRSKFALTSNMYPHQLVF